MKVQTSQDKRITLINTKTDSKAHIVKFYCSIQALLSGYLLSSVQVCTANILKVRKPMEFIPTNHHATRRGQELWHLSLRGPSNSHLRSDSETYSIYKSSSVKGVVHLDLEASSLPDSASVHRAVWPSQLSCRGKNRTDLCEQRGMYRKEILPNHRIVVKMLATGAAHSLVLNL